MIFKEVRREDLGTPYAMKAENLENERYPINGVTFMKTISVYSSMKINLPLTINGDDVGLRRR